MVRADVSRVEHACAGLESHVGTGSRPAERCAANSSLNNSEFPCRSVARHRGRESDAIGRTVATGLLLLGLAPGAPFIPKVVQIARGNLAFATGLMVLLVVGTAIDLPLFLPRVITGVEINAWQIEQSLFLLMLLPLFIGLAVHAGSGRCQRGCVSRWDSSPT